jgi:nucleoside-diphosphate-sugar epimerase
VCILIVLQIFDWLRKERPEALNKLVPVCGDISLNELGLSQADQKILADSVSVVFHSAATVKFDEALKLSVGMNIVGTKRIVQLCHKMVKLEVSSARFCCRLSTSPFWAGVSRIRKCILLNFEYEYDCLLGFCAVQCDK